MQIKSSYKIIAIVIALIILSIIPYGLIIALGTIAILALIPNHDTEHMPYSDYIAYLKSSTWKKKRKSILERDNYTCQECGKKLTISSAHCHHMSYKHLGDELPEELITLCFNCHANIHPELRN